MQNLQNTSSTNIEKSQINSFLEIKNPSTPIIIFVCISITLLLSKIYLFYSKTKFIPISDICSWISSMIIVAIVISSLFRMFEEGKMLKETMSAIIYVLIVGCILSSLGNTLNTLKLQKTNIYPNF
jgi:tellurite resistance protein TehA-like permease